MRERELRSVKMRARRGEASRCDCSSPSPHAGREHGAINGSQDALTESKAGLRDQGLNGRVNSGGTGNRQEKQGSAASRPDEDAFWRPCRACLPVCQSIDDTAICTSGLHEPCQR